MGIYDRDYFRPTRPPPVYSFLRPRSIVIALIVVNVAVWLADALSPVTSVDPHTGKVLGRWLSDAMAVHGYTLTTPWLWWQFLTAGFAHAPNFQHILFNMLVLFFLGRDVEDHYGSKEFLRLYLVMVVFSSLAWAAVSDLTGSASQGMYGASGAITGVVVLYALNFPHRTLLLFFVIPIPAWVAGVIFVVMDMLGAFGLPYNSKVAFTSHLAGAAFAFVYFQQRWNFSRLTEGRFTGLGSIFRRKPRLKVHKPEPDEDNDDDMTKEVDRILAKITREGEASLTAKERRTLETASREYQKRGKGGK